MTADQARELLKSSLESSEFQLEKINNKIESACKMGDYWTRFTLTGDETSQDIVISQLRKIGYNVSGNNSSNIICISWKE